MTSTGPTEDELQTVCDWVAEARKISVLTGAGISTDSGIPDFRGPQGLWTKNPEAEKMATLQVYMADPEVRKRSWRWRLETQQNKREPNAGHAALVSLERSGQPAVCQLPVGKRQFYSSAVWVKIPERCTVQQRLCHVPALLPLVPYSLVRSNVSAILLRG